MEQSSVSILSRLLAKAIDLLMALVVYLIVSPLSEVLGICSGVILCIIQDGMGVGQSVGKRMLGLQVVEEPNSIACSYLASCIRNLPFAILIFSSLLPPIRIVAVLVAVPVVILEAYLLMSLASGVRLGDVLANTKVVEYEPHRGDSSL